jgi:hypothetical protein
MSVFSGPEIANDGLVFAYDMNNSQKSWKGKPTTNFFTNGHFSNGTGITQESGSNPTNTVISFPNNPGETEYVLEQSMGIAQTEYQINLTTELVAGTTYVMSGWYAESADYSSADGSRMFHSRAFSTSGAHNALGTGIGTVIETRVINGITWRYCYATITTPADYSNSFNWYVGYGGSSYTGRRYYTNIQMEIGNFPSRFVNGARSNTQAILDLTNNNTVTANSLTYATDGTFSFNGTTNFITIPSLAQYNFGSSITVEIIHKNLGGDYRGIIANAYVSGTGFDFRYGRENYFGGTNNGTRLAAAIRTSVSNYGVDINAELNVWGHYIFTYNGITLQSYVNGLPFTSTPASGTLGTNVNPVTIGRNLNAGEYLTGNVPVAKIYNRALSAAEVQQNFNALRGRYGL